MTILQQVDIYVKKLMLHTYNTITGLGWILYCLSMNKQYQEMCRKEVREILAGRDSDDILW